MHCVNKSTSGVRNNQVSPLASTYMTLSDEFQSCLANVLYDNFGETVRSTVFSPNADGAKAMQIPLKDGTISTIHLKGEESDSTARRNMDPLFLCKDTTGCFCNFENFISVKTISLSNNSKVFFWKKDRKAHLASTQCGPEPTAAHYSDLLSLMHALKGEPCISTTNLCGSGASVPQHFHTALIPRGTHVTKLLGNFKEASTKLNAPGLPVSIITLKAPLWGVELRFNDTLSPAQQGTLLFEIIHKLRYRTQLKLSYNLYIDAATPSNINVLFRQADKESPFLTNEVVEIIDALPTSDKKLKGEKIRESLNSRWRWGWLESICGLPARDKVFLKDPRFDASFWGKIYDYMSLDKQYRDAIWESICQSAKNA